VIHDSNVLEESLSRKISSQIPSPSAGTNSINEEAADTNIKNLGSNLINSGNNDTSYLVQQLKNDPEFIVILSSKITEAIMSNETFKQIICDAVTLELREEVTNLKKQIQFSEYKIENLESNIENQAQYSRRNCLIIHGQPVKVDGNEDTDQIAINIFNEKLVVNVINQISIDHTDCGLLQVKMP